MKKRITTTAIIILAATFISYSDTTNDPPLGTPEFAYTKLTTKTITNVATVKRSAMTYGCAVSGCTQDHTTTWWERTTVVQKIIYGEIKGQTFELSRGDVSRTLTNFVPRVTAEGMTFEITTNGLGEGVQYGN